jgi:glucose/arabinose dehydrogenase
VLSRFTAVERDGALVGDPKSEEILLKVPQPYWNHKGGTVLFGPDGMVYLSLGDGGAAGDPHDAGQRMDTLLAKVIRIDVDTKGSDKPYSIPKDNPFVDIKGARGEIWAYGLRNIWRMDFDRATGLLWGGDVGQNAWEEIDLIAKGGNYGWKKREGRHNYSGGAERGDMIDPVVEYPRSDGLSVTGGVVVRGKRLPALDGVYLYADYAHGNIWGFRVADVSGPNGSANPTQVFRKGGLMVTSFALTGDGDVYLCAFEGGERGPGGIYKVGMRE